MRGNLPPSPISIHPPRVGRDDIIWIVMLYGLISIHPPRVGRDQGPSGQKASKKYFNPPSPCGERPKRFNVLSVSIVYFNPPSPCGERQEGLPIPIPGINFNPPSPCGERHALTARQTVEMLFQSTLPVWGETAKVHKNSFLFHALSTNSLAFFVTTSCFLGENQKTGGEFVKISVRRSRGNPGRFPLAPV